MNQGGVGVQQRGEESGGVMQSVQETAQEAASSAASTAEQAWDATSRGARQAASAVAETARSGWSDLRACMSRYPFGVFFAGIGVGALMALALEYRWMHAGRE
jgi:hypothetical protein